MEVCGELKAQAALSLSKEFHYTFYRGLGGLQSHLECDSKAHIFITVGN